jgi:uncharacterized protein
LRTGPRPARQLVDLAADLVTKDPPAQPPGNVIDFQSEALGRLRARVSALDSSNAELLAHSRDHQTSDHRLFTAVLAALDAGGLDHLIHIVTADWVDILRVDVVALALESAGQRVNLSTSGIQFLAAGGLDDLVPAEALVRVEAVDQGAQVFGPAASLVRSQALVRFGGEGAAPVGLLGLGSREETGFAGHGGSVGLLFLAQVLERCLVRWLSQTP